LLGKVRQNHQTGTRRKGHADHEPKGERKKKTLQNAAILCLKKKKKKKKNMSCEITCNSTLLEKGGKRR